MIARPRLLLSLASLVAATAIVLTGSAGAQTGSNSQWPEVQGRGVCYTQTGWCPLPYPDRTPVGVACYCVLPDGRQVYGVTMLNSYRGRVSPYFNPHAPQVPSTIR